MTRGSRSGRLLIAQPFFHVLLWGFVSLVAKARADDSPPNIHAVIVSSSRYWFNYRHAMNALGFYQILQENGIPDSQIVLMIADEYAINARNPFKNGMYANGVNPERTWYSEKTEVDYRGTDVTVQNFFDAVLGTGPKSLRHTNDESHLLLFVTGHGGDQFFKFQDEEEITAQDIANLMEELAARKKFRKVLFIADTCQAFTLFDKVTTPHVYALGTSLKNENAYAHHSDIDLGLAVIERWTYGFLNQYRKRSIHPATTTLHELMVAPFEGKTPLGANVGVMGNFEELRLHEFFGKPSRAKQALKKTSGPAENKIKVFVMPPSPQSTISPKRINVNSGKKTVSTGSSNLKEEESPSIQLDELSTLSHAFEPTDYSFGLLVGGLILLVASASRYGKGSDDDTI